MQPITRHLPSKKIRLLKPTQGLKVLAVLLTMVVLVWGWFGRVGAYAVLVDGEQVAVVAAAGEVEEALRTLDALKGESLPQGVTHREEVSVQPLRGGSPEPVQGEALLQILASRLTFVTQAVGIAINGEVKLMVASEQDGQAAIQQLKDTYKPQMDGIALESLELEEEVSFETVEADPADIMDVAQAVQILASGFGKVEKYTVRQGDSLWTIARNHNLAIQELLNANPQLTSDRLSIGQELNLVKAEPLVNVVATYRRTVTEYVPFPVKVINDNKLYRGQERVQQRGVEGKKEVQYRITERNGLRVNRDVLAEKVLAEPIPKVVARGTMVILASRGGGGSGELDWPLRGTITSPFGYRIFRGTREFHRGIDIDGNTGEPVKSAAAGTVIFAGWLGNYGNRIVLDHGDGLQTAYNHLSAIKVKVGDKVARQEIIGLVGSTGRSTGSHLDFEVTVNGEFRNPLDYLGR